MKTKSRFFHDATIRIAKIINIVLMTTPFIVAWYTFYADKLWVHFAMRGHWLVIALYVFLYVLIGRVYNAFNISYNRHGEMIYSQLLSLFEVNVIMYIVAWLLIRHMPAVLPVIGVMAAQIVFAVIWAYASQSWYYHTFPANKTVVVYDMRQGISRLINEYKLTKKFKVVSAVSADECIRDLTVLDDADTIFLIGVHSHDRNIIAKYCLIHDIKAFLIPRVGDLIITGSKRMHMFHLLLLKVERYNPSFEYLVLKRIGDIVLSLIAIVIFSPVILITAICIKAEDHGPILYKQCRLTKDGKIFNIYKFRSMRTDAEKDGIARLSTGDNDDRITKVGHFIRKVRIDEIPQLFNILAGDGDILRTTKRDPYFMRYSAA